jgi:hypothetical protein
MAFSKTTIFVIVQTPKKKYSTMNIKNKINGIKVLLGLEVALESAKLMDGTVVEAEAFEVGYPLFVLNEDGTKGLAPMGEHKLEDGTIVIVDEQGNIAEIKPVAEAEEAPEVEVTVEAAEVPVEEPVKEAVKDDIKEAMKKLAMIVEEVVKEVADVKTEMKSMKEKYEKFSATPGATKFPKVSSESFEATNSVDAKIALINELKRENFFKAK